jgi:hypothetical protein
LAQGRLKPTGSAADTTVMDGELVWRLRTALRQSGWWSSAQMLGDAVRRTERVGGLLVVGTPEVEPWHLTAHLDDEARLTGQDQLRPTLVRFAPPAGAAPHLSVGLRRLEVASPGETVLIVAPDVAPDRLLDRVEHARRVGATVLSVDGGDPQLDGLVHERMSVTPTDMLAPQGVECSFDLAQHLVSTAAGARTPNGRYGALRAALSRA